MDKIFERLGIYDILGVLLSGICMTVTTICLLHVFYPINGIDYFNIDAWHFLLISYAVGLVFQELANFLQQWIMSRVEFIIYRLKTRKDKAHITKYSRNMYLLLSVEPKENDCLHMQNHEIEEIKKVFRKEYNWENNNFDWNIAYNYCRAYMSKHGSHAKGDRDQALAAMARSLSLFCILTILFPIMGKLVCINFLGLDLVLNQILPILFGLLSILFYRRFRRFTCRRYISVFRFFLYHTVLKNKNQNINNEQNIMYKKGEET